MQCNQSTSAFSKICVSRFPESLNSKVEIYPNFCPSSIVPVTIALAIEVLKNFLPAPWMWLNKIPAQNLFSLHIWQVLALLLHNSFHDREQIRLLTQALISIPFPCKIQ